MLLLAPSLLHGEVQWEAELALDSGYTTNADATVFEDAATYHTAALTLGLQPKPELQLRYDGNALLRTDAGDRNATYHALGVSYSRLNQAGTIRWALSLSGQRSWNEPVYEIHDRNDISGITEVRWRAREAASLSATFGVLATRHHNLPELDANDVAGGVTASVSFATRTSLRVSYSLEHRRYLDSIGPVEPGDAPREMQVLRFANPWQRPRLRHQEMPEGEEDDAAATLHGLMLRIAQNLVPAIGVSLEGRWRGGLTGEGRYLDEQNQSTVSATLVADDRFASRLLGGEVGLHYRLSASHRFDAAVVAESRTYDDSPALDLDGVALNAARQDDLLRTELTYRLTPSRLPYLWQVSYVHSRNQSNDALYDYTADDLRVGMVIILH
jgi:hypothetical protein